MKYIILHDSTCWVWTKQIVIMMMYSVGLINISQRIYFRTLFLLKWKLLVSKELIIIYIDDKFLSFWKLNTFHNPPHRMKSPEMLCFLKICSRMTAANGRYFNSLRRSCIWARRVGSWTFVSMTWTNIAV